MPPTAAAKSTESAKNNFSARSAMLAGTFELTTTMTREGRTENRQADEMLQDFGALNEIGRDVEGFCGQPGRSAYGEVNADQAGRQGDRRFFKKKGNYEKTAEKCRTKQLREERCSLRSAGRRRWLCKPYDSKSLAAIVGTVFSRNSV
jgi:hypothetical protein